PAHAGDEVRLDQQVLAAAAVGVDVEPGLRAGDDVVLDRQAVVVVPVDRVRRVARDVVVGDAGVHHAAGERDPVPHGAAAVHVDRVVVNNDVLWRGGGAESLDENPAAVEREVLDGRVVVLRADQPAFAVLAADGGAGAVVGAVRFDGDSVGHVKGAAAET